MKIENRTKRNKAHIKFKWYEENIRALFHEREFERLESSVKDNFCPS